MREPTYLMIVALASTLVAPPFFAFAQQDDPSPIEPPPLETPPIEAPPIETDRPGGEVTNDATSTPLPQKHFYYHPGDLEGVPYDTMEDCTKARRRAGNVGVCVMK